MIAVEEYSTCLCGWWQGLALKFAKWVPGYYTIVRCKTGSCTWGYSLYVRFSFFAATLAVYAVVTVDDEMWKRVKSTRDVRSWVP